jgi:hypothetical protein
MRIHWFCCAMVLAASGAAFGQDTNFADGPQYLMTTGSPLFARSISTPSISLSAPPLEVGATTATADLTAGADTQTVTMSSPDSGPAPDLLPIYYGVIPVQRLEISFWEPSRIPEVPLSLFDIGVTDLSTVRALRGRGVGVTIVEAAADAKSNVRHASRVYTNADIERLHNGVM